MAAFNTTTGALTAWAPQASREVKTLIVSPDGSQVIIGGNFDTINGNPPHGLGAVYADTGASAPWETGLDYRDATHYSWATDMDKDTDTIYVSAAGTGTFDGRLAVDPNGGTLRWIDNCLGGSEAVSLLDGVLYSGSHAHDCSSQPDGFPDIKPNYQRLLAEPAKPTGDTPPILHWFPITNSGPTAPNNQGPRAMHNDGKHLWVGGDFTQVNRQPQQSLTRFATMTAGQDTNPPEGPEVPQVTKPDGTTSTLRIGWTQTYDRDNKTLKYEVVRDDSTVIHTVESASKFWALKPMTFTDTRLTPGSTHTYTIRATDPFGNVTSRKSAPRQVS
ncbi:hypothetical protein [Actinomadura sp. 6N118]|uniref:hypothetical protein n=1 Tax=Actinomadura sp. 6N118 TaxID=3375151 RepID=UPI0037AD1035